MRNYVQAYLDAVGSGYIQSEVVKWYIQQQITIDKILPDSASFFYVVESPSLTYHFMGRQQESVSGYTNEEFLSQGVELFIKCLHPDDVDIILNQVFQEGMQVIKNADDAEKYNMVLQYNYRFKRATGEFINLLEQLYVLEIDQDGAGIMFLGNVIVLDNDGTLPIRLSVKHYRDNSTLETVFSKTFNRDTSYPTKITDREIDILRNLAVGKSNEEIGRTLHISPHSVDMHRHKLLEKLECKSVVELAQLAFRNGLL